MTGLQWAVLQAYARTLPLGTERFQLRSLTYSQRPERMGVALVQAAALGYLKNGHITLAGAAVACEYLLRCEDVSASVREVLYQHLRTLMADSSTPLPTRLEGPP